MAVQPSPKPDGVCNYASRPETRGEKFINEMNDCSKTDETYKLIESYVEEENGCKLISLVDVGKLCLNPYQFHEIPLIADMYRLRIRVYAAKIVNYLTKLGTVRIIMVLDQEGIMGVNSLSVMGQQAILVGITDDVVIQPMDNSRFSLTINSALAEFCEEYIIALGVNVRDNVFIDKMPTYGIYCTNVIHKA